MSHPRELLDSAHALLRFEPQTQATLRRAVSTAYYALFHLLVDEVCLNWSRPEHRHRMARMLEHRNMNSASNRRADDYRNASRATPEGRLYTVAYAFKELQVRRHTADYDLSRTFSGSDVALDILLVEEAFENWALIRGEQVAQDYCFLCYFGRNELRVVVHMHRQT